MSFIRATHSVARRNRCPVRLAGLVLIASSIVSVFAGPPAALASTPDFVWVGPDGQPLPFRTHAEVLEFLSTAEVVSSSVIEAGSSPP